LICDERGEGHACAFVPLPAPRRERDSTLIDVAS